MDGERRSRLSGMTLGRHRISTDMEYDLFICHASEDKETFVRELATCLREKGLAVWYDEFALRLGDSLSESINKGLASSSFGVVVISPQFIAKRWPRRELAALVAREDAADKVILPIWHGVTKQDVLTHLPLLADKLAAHSSAGVEAVSDTIYQVVSPGGVAEARYRLGLELERNGDPHGATSRFIEVLQIDRNHPGALQHLVAMLPGPILRRAPIILGRVKFYSAQKGFGFITADDGQEYFVHVSTLESHGIDIVRAGEPVAFLVAEGKGSRRIVASVRSLRDNHRT